MKKRNFLYILAYIVILVINILVVVNHKTDTTLYMPALLLMITMVIHAVLSYLLRHKGNYLPFRRFGRPNPFTADKTYTFEDLYTKRFFFMLKIYCLSIPFYIPQIFLTSNYFSPFLALGTFFSPQVVYIILGIIDTLKDIKEHKAKENRIEKERLDQERKEELGKWK